MCKNVYRIPVKGKNEDLTVFGEQFTVGAEKISNGRKKRNREDIYSQPQKRHEYKEMLKLHVQITHTQQIVCPR